MGKISRLLAKLMADIPAGHEYYSGEFADGEADYVYIPTSNGHVLDGNFKYKRRQEAVVSQAEGIFGRGFKIGDWMFYSKSAEFSRKLNTYFVDGFIYGDIDLIINHIAEGYTEDLSMTVINGEISGRITGHFDKGYFTGSCDDHGFPDGTWTMAIKEGRKTILTKKEIWVHGRFKEAYEVGADKQRLPMEPYLRDRINLILMNEVPQLLNIVAQGTKDDILHIHSK